MRSWWLLRRRRTRILITVGLALCAAAVVVVISSPEDPRSKLRATLETFPIPAGATSDGITTYGDSPLMCAVNMGCEDPRGNINGPTGGTGAELCTSLEDSLRAWASSVTPGESGDPDEPCYWEFTIGSMGGQAFVIDKPGYGTLWTVHLWP